MARHPHLRRRAGASEHRERIREALAGTKREVVLARLGHADLTGKVALPADTVPFGGRKLRRIDHGFARGNVIASGAMASLAGDTAFQKRRRGIGVLLAGNPLYPAGV